MRKKCSFTSRSSCFFIEKKIDDKNYRPVIGSEIYEPWTEQGGGATLYTNLIVKFELIIYFSSLNISLEKIPFPPPLAPSLIQRDLMLDKFVRRNGERRIRISPVSLYLPRKEQITTILYLTATTLRGGGGGAPPFRNRPSKG